MAQIPNYDILASMPVSSARPSIGSALSTGISSAVDEYTDLEKLKLLKQQSASKQKLASLKLSQAKSGLGGTLPQAFAAQNYLDKIGQKFGKDSDIYKKYASIQKLGDDSIRAKSLYYGSSARSLGSLGKMQALQDFNHYAESAQKQGVHPMTQGEWMQKHYGLGNDQSNTTVVTDAPKLQASHIGNINNSNLSTADKVNAIKHVVTPAIDYHTRNSQIGLKLVNMTTDAPARQKLRYATNVDNTLKMTNSDMPLAMHYSSPQGAIQLGRDRARAVGAHGYTSPSLQSYINFNKNLGILKLQMVQFFQASKQPEIAKGIEKDFNTIDFSSNPTQSVNTLKNIESLYDQERHTLIRASNDSTLYTAPRKSLASDLTEKVSANYDDNLAFTAKKHGLTVEQVKNMLASKGK